MQLLNLAIITRRVAGTPTETGEMADSLRRLDVQFPFAFLKNINMSEDSPHIVGNSYLRDETFEVALAIRLQTTVMEIQRDFDSEPFDVDAFIQSMFYAQPPKQDTLRAWDVNGLGSGDLGLLPEYDAKMRRYIRRLSSSVQDDAQDIADGSEEGMQILTRNFPWLDFRATVLRWAKLRMEEIMASIDSAGGIERLMDEVKAELSKDANFDPDADVPPPRSPAKQKERAVITRYGAMGHSRDCCSRPGTDYNFSGETRQTSVSIASPSLLLTTNGKSVRTGSRQDNRRAFSHIEEVEKPRNPAHTALLNRIDENQRQRKENIRRQPASTISPSHLRQFVDEQEGAERITNFGDGTQPSPRQRADRHSAQSSRAKRKRPETAVEEDVSEDEGFESDNREVDMSQRRRDAPRPESSLKRVRIREPDQDHQATPTQDDTDEQNDRVREYAEQKKIMSSQATRAVQSLPRQPRPRQMRRGWSAAEELRLEEYISEYGISWAYLKEVDREDGNMFEGRDQVALKDKARNMKTQMLL
jgi:hypothetical protein